MSKLNESDLLRCLVHLIGRAAIAPDKVREVVGSGKKQLKAFNLCDGDHTLIEIAKKAKIDRGNLSRTASRWLRNGIVFWVGEGQDARLLHAYPVPENQKPAKT